MMESIQTAPRTILWVSDNSEDEMVKREYTSNSTAHPTVNTSSTAYHMMLMSEKVLAKYWDTPEEDEAWSHL